MAHYQQFPSSEPEVAPEFTMIRNPDQSFAVVAAPNGQGYALASAGSFKGAWRMGAWSQSNRGMRPIVLNPAGGVRVDIATGESTARSTTAVGLSAEQCVMLAQNMRCPWGARAPLNEVFHRYNAEYWGLIP